MKKAIRVVEYLLFIIKIKFLYGKHVQVGKTGSIKNPPNLSLSGNGRIIIGDHCAFEGGSIASAENGTITIGAYTCFGEHDILVSRQGITIGEKCIIAPNVVIYDHDHKYDQNGYAAGYNSAEVIIGNHVWLGANVTILKGTVIGDNSVIGAGCVIKGNIPKNSMVYNQQNLMIQEIKTNE